MILEDTSVWVDFFRRGLPKFSAALEAGLIAIHPVVLGELATGNLANPPQTLAALGNLSRSQVASDEECLAFIETHSLYGRGIGWNDVQLLASARLSHVPIWSLDTRLNAAAIDLGVAFKAN